MTYPYYIIPAIEELPESSGEKRLTLIRRIAAAIGDPTALRAIIGIDPREFLDFYPDIRQSDLTTDETIDNFLEKFAPASMNASAGPDELVYAPAVPYDLSQLENLPEISSAPLIPETETPVRKSAPKAEHKDKALTDTESPSEPLLSESLAKIMIKNGNYQKAIEIITEISLNNPKKSVYFADQIRFLKKLIKYTSVSK